MKKLAITAAVAVGLSLAAGAASAQTVVLVRHAEKADASRDPVLSEAGVRRAGELDATFGDHGPELVLVSPFQRTFLTAGPTIDAFDSEMKVVALDQGVDAHVAAVVTEVRSRPRDALVLVVGHSNTVPLIARALGVEAADMPECEYDRMTRIDLNEAAPTVHVTRYGAPADC
ncbi:phosphoglycerate mutase family protein [Brevundimonas sp.]|jgi:broad specificity phosphatase PhoE|uniref:SixA phosphatase family protein n=1 Tax=Brevundimonas sp. TaxID=1871086 RepID=UPI002E11619F|nr:phosphoglycerate mutase family protein [Brevundimonas sp.]